MEEDQGLTVRLLIGAFIPRSQRGGETNQRDRLEMQKRDCPKVLEVLRQQSMNSSSHRSSEEERKNIFTSDVRCSFFTYLCNYLRPHIKKL